MKLILGGAGPSRRRRRRRRRRAARDDQRLVGLEWSGLDFFLWGLTWRMTWREVVRSFVRSFEWCSASLTNGTERNGTGRLGDDEVLIISRDGDSRLGVVAGLVVGGCVLLRREDDGVGVLNALVLCAGISLEAKEEPAARRGDGDGFADGDRRGAAGAAVGEEAVAPREAVFFGAEEKRGDDEGREGEDEEEADGDGGRLGDDGGRRGGAGDALPVFYGRKGIDDAVRADGGLLFEVLAGQAELLFDGEVPLQRGDPSLADAAEVVPLLVDVGLHLEVPEKPPVEVERRRRRPRRQPVLRVLRRRLEGRHLRQDVLRQERLPLRRQRGHVLQHLRLCGGHLLFWLLLLFRRRRRRRRLGL
mmetsp:Transcript_9010/g.29234  ORF Transcript_9010/g.29234 Transcript_9010/m.29234 type:complete len:361 (+) Transcript_9010:3-1085(+)